MNTLQSSWALPHGMHNALQGNGPVRPVCSALAVHNIGRPQGAVSAQLCRAPIDECAVAKDDLIFIPWRHTCTCCCLCQSCSSAASFHSSLHFHLPLTMSSQHMHTTTIMTITQSALLCRTHLLFYHK